MGGEWLCRNETLRPRHEERTILETLWHKGLGRRWTRRWRLRIQNIVETGRQLLQDQRRQPRTGQETHAKKLDNVRVAEGIHQLTLPHKLARFFIDALAWHLSVLEKVVDLLGSAHGSGNSNLLHTAVPARPDSPAGGASRGLGCCAEEGLVKL